MVFSLGRSVGRRVSARSLPGGFRTFTTAYYEKTDELGQFVHGMIAGAVVYCTYKVATYSRKMKAEDRVLARYRQSFETAAQATEAMVELVAESEKEITSEVIVPPSEWTQVDGSVSELVPMSGK